MKAKRNTMLALLALSLTSCTFDANFRSYVMAHRINYNVTRQHYTELVTADPSLSESDKALFIRRIDSEEAMIYNAEKLLGIKK